MGEDKKQIQLNAQKTGKGTILEGPIVPVLFSVSVPLMVTNFINAVYNLTDGLWVAQLSLVEFSATSFIWPPHYLFISLGIGISIAGTAIISQLIGAGERERAESYATHVFYFCLFIGAFFSIVGYFLSPSIVRWMGATGALRESATKYFSILMTGFVFEMVYLSFYAILGAQGKTRVTTRISAISAVLNIVLDPLFIFTRIPLINLLGLGLGIAGAAWATVISQVVRMILGAVAIRSNVNEVRLRLKNTKLTSMQFVRLARTGFPTALGQSSAALGFTLMHSLIVAYGDATITAYAAVNRVNSFIMMPASGIGGALTPLVGQNMGADNRERARDFARAAFRYITYFTLIGGAAMWFLRHPILSLFIRETGVHADLVWEQSLEYVIYSALMTPAMGYFNAFSGIFSGAGYHRYAAFISILRLWGFRLPLIFLFKTFTNFGATGLWISMLASNILIILVGIILYKKGKWYTNPIVRH
ncbi:MAG: MATE family efflux transporter [Clostridiaceae bacterium]|nr:MATE family efflux transporter [Clostridia bacterium]MBP6949438.1 MATE family efflux transporter [Clostridia bacterium]NMA35322.1 MATE family efflux transporter [Clostridiaceae bacterium]